MATFSTTDNRLDEFWMDVIPKSDDYADLRAFLKMVLILSHGNAFAETGFSINKELLIENLTEHSLVEQRRVYDAITHHGGIKNVDITRSMIHAVRNSRGLYQDRLKEKRAEEDAASRSKAAKRQNSEKIKDLKKKKQKILDDARKQTEDVEEELKKLM